MFKMWSLFHYLFILSPFIFTAIFHFSAKNKTQEQKRIFGIILSSIAVLLLFLRNLEIFVKSGYRFDAEILPLQICHFANFVLLFAFIKKSNVLFALAFCLNLPAAITSIIFANSLENYSTLISFRAQAYLWGHMLIVAITLWALLNDFIKITKKTFIRTIISMFVIYLVSVPVNYTVTYLTGKLTHPANYFYSLVPEEGTPLEMFYNLGKPIDILSIQFNPLYLFITMIFGLFIVSLLFLIYWFSYGKKLNANLA